MITKSFLIYDDTDIYEIVHDSVMIIRILKYDNVLQKQSSLYFAQMPENVQEQVLAWMQENNENE